MNINQAINKMLLVLSQNKDVFYLEKRTYKKGMCYKSYLIKINRAVKTFDRKTDLLMYLKGMI